MSSVASTNTQNFETEVLKSDLPVLVDFYAEWCGPCKMMGPVIDKAAGQLAGKMKVLKLDTDVSPEIAGRYGIMGVPTLILFKGGQPVGKNVGYLDEAGLGRFLQLHV